MPEAPPTALLIQAFVNTVDVELGTDDVDTPARLGAWLAERGLLDPGVRVGPTEHGSALALRAGLRERLGVPVGDAPDPDLLRRADEVSRSLPLVVELGLDERPAALVPGPELGPVQRALAELTIAWSTLVGSGEATRLKRCPEHGCRWVFWDVSKNRSRRWCSMEVCGNRTKARRYAARHTRPTDAPAPEPPNA